MPEILYKKLTAINRVQFFSRTLNLSYFFFEIWGYQYAQVLLYNKEIVIVIQQKVHAASGPQLAPQVKAPIATPGDNNVYVA
jgi:hypothetical protein